MALRQIDVHLLDDLFIFIENLRLSGYPIGTHQFLLIQELLIRLNADNKFPKNISGLYSFLSPLICTTPDQQADFKHRFAEWIHEGPIEQEETETEPLSHTEKTVTSIKQKSRRLFFGWTIAVILVCVMGLFYLNLPIKSEEASSGALIEPTSPINEPNLQGRDVTGSLPSTLTSVKSEPEPVQMTETIEETSLAETVISKAVQTASINKAVTRQVDNEPRKKPGLPKPDIPRPKPNNDLLIYLGGAICIFLGGILLRWLYLANTALHLQRQYSDTEVNMNEFFVKEPEPHLFQSVAFFRTAQQFRKHLRVQSNRLDVPKTVNKTVEQGGCFSPVTGFTVRQPEYLILIDRMTYHDHQTDMINTLAARLIENDIHVSKYYFDEDPRSCIPADGKTITYLNLSQLYFSHPNHHLMIFSNGKFLINPVTGELAKWIDQFKKWTNRAILLPDMDEANQFIIPFSNADFMIMPADESGLSLLIDQWQADAADPALNIPAQETDSPDFFNWSTTRLFSNNAPEENRIKSMQSELKTFLDPKGYHWLCACAVYPGLIWNLTLYLGHQLKDKDQQKIYHIDRLKRLIRLPWFRYGRMPDWLRSILIKYLKRRQRKTVRKALFQLFLSAKENPVRSFALEYAIKKKTSDSLAKAFFKRIRPKKQKSKILQDHIFVTFMRDDLSVKLPKIASIVRPQYDKPIYLQWHFYFAIIAVLAALFVNQWSKRNTHGQNQSPKWNLYGYAGAALTWDKQVMKNNT